MARERIAGEGLSRGEGIAGEGLPGERIAGEGLPGERIEGEGLPGLIKRTLSLSCASLL